MNDTLPVIAIAAVRHYCIGSVPDISTKSKLLPTVTLFIKTTLIMSFHH